MSTKGSVPRRLSTRPLVIACSVLALLALAYRTAYIVDCRRSTGRLERCWQEGPLVISIDEAMRLATISGLAGWAGFNTYNPGLSAPRKRDPKQPPPQ